jgi:hypothetical protein
MAADLDDVRAVAHEMRSEHLPDGGARSGKVGNVVCENARRSSRVERCQIHQSI